MSFQIERGDRIALVGANGAGKSTLIRMLSGLEAPTSGTIKLGHNVLADYFAQDQYKVLDGIGEDAGRHCGDRAEGAGGGAAEPAGVLHVLGRRCVQDSLGVLSGGERNRYAMAKMLVCPANMLLLDEPTNHLDLRAKDVLLDAIRNFTGTVLFVSHDRYFIDGLATRVFEVEDRRVHIYPGNYEDYLWRKQGGPEKVTASVTNFIAAAVPVTVPVTNPVVEAKKTVLKKLNPIKLKLLEEEVAAAEETIAEWERRIAVAEERLGVFTTPEESQAASADLDRLRGEHAELIELWERLGMELEEQRD